MSRFSLQPVRFIGSMLDVKTALYDASGTPLPEIALVGKSNVGKSSLINHLVRQKKLAYVSTRPGRTSTLNFYQVGEAFVFVDFPGYGYATHSRSSQESWSEAIDLYLRRRSPLKLLLLLVDSRRGLSKDDLQMVDWASHYQKPLLLIFTKSDTIKPHEKKGLSERTAAALPTTPHLYYSIKEKASRERLLSFLQNLLKEGENGAAP